MEVKKSFPFQTKRIRIIKKFGFELSFIVDFFVDQEKKGSRSPIFLPIILNSIPLLLEYFRNNFLFTIYVCNFLFREINAGGASKFNKQ